MNRAESLYSGRMTQPKPQNDAEVLRRLLGLSVLEFYALLDAGLDNVLTDDRRTNNYGHNRK